MTFWIFDGSTSLTTGFRFWIEGAERAVNTFPMKSLSENRKWAIQNPKWLGLSIIAFVLVICGAVAEAQQLKKVPRIGLLSVTSTSTMLARVEAFRRGLRDLGYVEGKDIFIEYRYADGKQDRFSDLASELIQLKVDLIVTATTAGVRAVQTASSTVPIVFAGAGDPVRSGLVASLARPGGNITGLSILAPELDGKRLELLKETFPKIVRVAYFWNPDSPGTGLSGMQAAAPALGLQLQSLEVRRPKDFDSAFTKALGDRADAITAQPIAIVNNHRTRIINFSVHNRLPGIYADTEFVEAGGLMSYSISFPELYRRAATYVDKILKGTKPADLPVEQPTKFEFVINLKTAKQIGLTIPPNVLARADRVIR
jgi:putative ABC transport system substrate-binding protein